jgi:beta-phosphoglucomutase
MRAVIFDFDGVLVDSEPVHFRELRSCLAHEGITIDKAEYLGHYLGYDDRGAIRTALERHGVDFSENVVDRIVACKGEHFSAGDIPFFPGARQLVRSLSALPLGIASGATRRDIEAVLLEGGLGEAFAVIVAAEDVARGKPDPEPYLVAARRLRAHAPGLRPEECLAFEDSLPGVAAARAAGMTVVAVTNSYPASQLSAAHLVVDSLEGFTLPGLRARLEG